MGILNSFYTAYIKPVINVDFKKTKAPLIHPLSDIFTRRNPYWTAFAFGSSAYLGISLALDLTLATALIVAPLLTIGIFSAAMFLFNQAKIGPYTPGFVQEDWPMSQRCVNDNLSRRVFGQRIPAEVFADDLCELGQGSFLPSFSGCCPCSNPSSDKTSRREALEEDTAEPSKGCCTFS